MLNMPWMEEIRRQLNEKVNQVNLTRAFTKMKEDNMNIPTWWPTGRTVLLPKTKHLKDERNYLPITCLKTSYKIMIGMVAKYMRKHTMKN